MSAGQGTLRRRNLPATTSRMTNVLKHLRDAQNADSPFVIITGVHWRTINALVERDWIILDPGLDGDRCKITGRGLKALAVYEPTVKRSDGICCRCCERPRARFSTGTLAPYCKECISRIAKREYQLGMNRTRPMGLCARCGKRPRFVTSTGRAYSYCKRCKNLRRRREHRRERKALLVKIRAGEHVACRHHNCDQCRYISGNTVQDYCYEHYREYMNAYARERNNY